MSHQLGAMRPGPCEQGLSASRKAPLLSLPQVAQAPDAAIAVFGNQDAAIGHQQQSHGTAPDIGGVRVEHPAGDDFPRWPGRPAVFKGNESDGLADALGAVPGAVESQQSAALIFGGKLSAGIEEDRKSVV